MVEAIIAIVSDHYGVTATQLKGSSRAGVLPEARRMTVLFIVRHENKRAASEAVNKNRTYPYRCLQKIANEIEIYADVQDAHDEISRKIIEYKNNKQ